MLPARNVARPTSSRSPSRAHGMNIDDGNTDGQSIDFRFVSDADGSLT